MTLNDEVKYFYHFLYENTVKVGNFKPSMLVCKGQGESYFFEMGLSKVQTHCSLQTRFTDAKIF